MDPHELERVADDGAVGIHRLPIDYSAYVAIQEPANPSAAPGLLLACHGYAQSCKGFIRNFAGLRDRNWLVVAPQGVSQLYWEGGKVGFNWMTKYMREFTIQDNLAYMQRLLDRLETQYTFDRSRVVSLGFSQGSAMAYRVAANVLDKPRGVVACGGDLPPDIGDRLGQLAPFPVLIVHGKDDTSMRYDKAREGEQQLRDAGWPVETYYFDGAHELPGHAVDRAVEWMGSL